MGCGIDAVGEVGAPGVNASAGRFVKGREDVGGELEG